MKLSTNTYWGTNPYCKNQCIVVSLIDVSESERKRISDNANASLEYLASNFRYKKQLIGTTFPDEIGLHIAHASLFILNYVRGDLDEYGFTNKLQNPSIYIEFHNPNLAVEAVKIILHMFLNFKNKNTKNYNEVLSKFWNLCRKEHPDFQAHALISSAKSRGLHFAPLGNRYWLYGMGVNSKIFFETSTIEDLRSPFKTDKTSGKYFFNSLGVPTANYQIAESYDETLSAAIKIGFPCVIKPVRGGGGKGVTANIISMDQIPFAYKEAGKYLRKSKKIMVERFVEGDDYRLITVGGKFIACVNRRAPFVIGDGINTIEELIHLQINQYRTLNLYESRYKRPMPVDAEVEEMLKLQDLSLDSVIPQGKSVKLRRNDNLSTGGSAKIIDNINPEVVLMAEKISRQSGMYSLGIDYITTDISLSPFESGGNFIEINRTQGIDTLLAADYDVIKAGTIFLGESTNNIEIDLHIFHQSKLNKLVQNYSGENAVFLPNVIVQNGVRIDAKNLHFTNVVNKFLSDKSLLSGDIFASVEFINTNGIPIKNLRRIIIEKSSLTASIGEMFRHSKCTVVHMD